MSNRLPERWKWRYERKAPWTCLKWDKNFSAKMMCTNFFKNFSKRMRRPTMQNIFEPVHDKTCKIACAPSEDLDQPGHPPSLIRVFAVRLKKAWVLTYPMSTQRRLADVKADLRWAHMPVWWFFHALAFFFFFCQNKSMKCLRIWHINITALGFWEKLGRKLLQIVLSLIASVI